MSADIATDRTADASFTQPGSMSMKTRLLFVVLFALGTSAECSHDQQPPDQASAQTARTKDVQESATRATPPTERYLLVSVLGSALPKSIPPTDPAECGETVLSGWYQLTGNSWVSFDSVKVTCPPGHAPIEKDNQRYSGRILRAHDTLTFVSYDSANKGDLELDRGVLRNDTLFTGGVLFDGPSHVYVRK